MHVSWHRWRRGRRAPQPAGPATTPKNWTPETPRRVPSAPTIPKAVGSVSSPLSLLPHHIPALPHIPRAAATRGWFHRGWYLCAGGPANRCPSARMRAEHLAHTPPLSVIQPEKRSLSSSSAVRTIKYSRYDVPHPQRSPWCFERPLAACCCYFPSHSHCQATIDLLFHHLG